MNILNELNVVPNNYELFLTSFTHTSYCNENKDCESYNITFKIIPKNKILSDEENKINLKEEK